MSTLMSTKEMARRLVEARRSMFTEGEPADPTLNMSEEQKAEWKKQNEAHRDEFRSAADEAEGDTSARYEEGDMSPAEQAAWEKKHPELAKNKDNPPPEVEALKNKMQGKKAGEDDIEIEMEIGGYEVEIEITKKTDDGEMDIEAEMDIESPPEPAQVMPPVVMPSQGWSMAASQKFAGDVADKAVLGLAKDMQTMLDAMAHGHDSERVKAVEQLLQTWSRKWSINISRNLKEIAEDLLYKAWKNTTTVAPAYVGEVMLKDYGGSLTFMRAAKAQTYILSLAPDGMPRVDGFVDEILFSMIIAKILKLRPNQVKPAGRNVIVGTERMTWEGALHKAFSTYAGEFEEPPAHNTFRVNVNVGSIYEQGMRSAGFSRQRLTWGRKASDGATSDEESAEGAEERAEADEEKADAERDEAQADRSDAASKEAALRTAYFTVVVPPGVTKWQSPRRSLTRGAFDTQQEAHAWAKKNVPGEHYKVKEIEDVLPSKEAAGGLYGFTKQTQNDVETTIRKAQKKALAIAKAAYRGDERVVGFLQSHAKRANSDSARLLLAAMSEIGPKVASERTSADKSIGLYGFPTRTAMLGLNACTELRAHVGQVAYDLHSRRTARHAHIMGYLKEHSKQAKCGYSRMLLGCYPDAPKTASGKPSSVSDWLTWEG